MSQQQHTPEPWEVFDLYGDPEIREKKTGKLVSALRPERLKDARRIVACVNACAGISDTTLEIMTVSGGLGRDRLLEALTRQRDELQADIATVEQEARQMRARMQRVERERDELLAALERLTFAAECRDNTVGDPCRLIQVKAELAAAAANASTIIASVKNHFPDAKKMMEGGAS